MLQSQLGKGGKGKSRALPKLQPNSLPVRTESHQPSQDDSPTTSTLGKQENPAGSLQLTAGLSLKAGVELQDSVASQADIPAMHQSTLAQVKQLQSTETGRVAESKNSVRVKGKKRENATDEMETIVRERDQAKAEYERIKRDMEHILRERDDASIETERLQGAMEKIRHERDQAKIGSDRLERAQSEKMVKLALLMQSERGSHEKKIRDLESQASLVQTNLEIATTTTYNSTTRIESLEQQILALQADLDSGHREASEKTGKLETENRRLVAEMEESHQADKNRIESLERDISALQNELDDIHREAELRVDTLKAENHTLHEELAAQTETIGSLTRENTSQAAVVGSLTGHKTSLQEEKTSVTYELDRSNKEISILREQAVVLEEEIAHLRATLAKGLGENVSMADQIKRLRQENTDMADETKSLRYANELLSTDVLTLGLMYDPEKLDENPAPSPARQPPSSPATLPVPQPGSHYLRNDNQPPQPDKKPAPPNPRKPIPRPRPVAPKAPKLMTKPLPPVPEIPKPYQLYARWITVDLAMKKSRLCDIPPYVTPLASDMTVSDLRALLLGELHVKRMGHGSRNSTLELFANSFHVSTVDHRAVSLADLELRGTEKDPLDICLVYLSDGPGSSMDFPYTTRAIATFRSCLRIFLTEVRAQNCLASMLEVIWEVTHFPPAVIAFKELYEKGDEVPLSCAIVASCIRALVQTVVPGWTARSLETSLEFSRPVFAGIYSQTLQRHESVVREQDISRSVTLAETTERSGMSPSVVNIDVCQTTPLSSNSAALNTKKSTRRICVYRAAEDDVKSTFLALAKWGRYDSVADYYFYRPGYILQKHTYPLRQKTFHAFIDSANRVEKFKVVCPQQLGSVQPPFITLNKDGYVSVYDLKSIVRGEVYPSIWNAVSGEQSLAGEDPGQFLLQALQPIVKKRQMEETWEVDAWTVEEGVTGGLESPEEAIVICIDRSGSMARCMAHGWDTDHTSSPSEWNPIPEYCTPPSVTASTQLSRMTEVKELFENLVARMAADKIPAHLGLLTTPMAPSVDQDPTPVLYDIKDKLKTITATGCEMIYDTLDKALLMLVSFQVKHPKAKLRVIFLSDGESHEYRASETCQALCAAGIVVDSIFIGGNPGDELFKISLLTGGYTFHPENRTALFQIPLIESFIDIRRRPDIQRRIVTPSIYASTAKPAADFKSHFDCPPARPHEHQSDVFIPLKHAARLGSSSSAALRPSGLGRTSDGSVASGRERILLKEVRLMEANPHTYMDVYVSERNIGFWKVVMQGPPDSPYGPGTFVLFVDMNVSYPRQPPDVRFITPILHPNITKQGRICHPIFDRDWDPETRIYEVLQQLWGMLVATEIRDSVNPIFAMKIWTDPESGRRDIAEHIRRFAAKTPKQLKADIEKSWG